MNTVHALALAFNVRYEAVFQFPISEVMMFRKIRLAEYLDQKDRIEDAKK